MPEARVPAQAKINLRLKVLARGTDGFHSIETIFGRIDLADDVVVRIGGSARSLDCKGADLGPVERNLAYRAAVAYADATSWPDAFSIELTKRIPAGGGLGGGSADAGAVLRALDAMSPRPLGPRLITLAAELGSDVPFLTLDNPFALAWSRGERLMPLPTLPWHPIVILTPSNGISTADAYGWVSETRMGFAPTAFIIDAPAVRDWTRMAAIATNDFDSVVFARFPELARAAASLRQHGALISILAGSGSSVIGIFEDQKTAEKALADSPIPGVLSKTSTSVAPVQVAG
ncbi:MAG TPA: 4-(cytidine 5'-diphospho)-2-C-methyl-D-erythritol kinase [Gemmatimonadaceae bacterium]|nr:4-(cytidine 5'-diphospho)-2-C-methyl-D-erythritol kinase [Gemmatimonadaceae bacterium]